jgi:hypothetical protein
MGHGTLLPGNDESVLLAEALQVPTGRDLDLVAEMAGELLAVPLGPSGIYPGLRSDTHTVRL